jgi:hypothetical protein
MNEVDTMRQYGSVIRLVFLVLVAAVVAGCGGSKPGGAAPADYSTLAKQKVEVVRKMADGVANDPSGVAVLGAYEEFVNLPLEVKEHPNEAKEILEIYNKRIRGKLKGEVAVQMQTEMARYQALLAGSK